MSSTWNKRLKSPFKAVSKTEQNLIKVKDYALSGEEFELVFDSNLQLYKTTPQPDALKLSDHYKSEDYISHTDYKRNLKEKLYHIVKQFTLKNKLKLINNFQTDSKTLLDFGCGTGDFLKVCQKDSWIITGIEPNENARNIANQKLSNKVFDVAQLSQFKNNSFDVITLWHVLEHLPNYEEDLKTLKNLLKPEGVLVIAVPNFKCWDAKHYQSFWAAWDVPRHLWHFSQDAISKLMGYLNMKVTQIEPMYFDAFYVSLLSENYKGVKYPYLKSLIVGLRSNMSAWRTGEYSSLIYVVKKSKN
jgi:2-polyprenyl-3-methyl-5-hydroxy-6-metoxy-1,4-benzoquinol methylase